MRCNPRACKVSPFWVKPSRSWALQAHVGRFGQPWVFGGGPKRPPAAGSVAIWPSAPTALLISSAAAMPLFLPTQTVVICSFLISAKKIMLDEQLTGLFETWLVTDGCHGTDTSVYCKGRKRLLCSLLYDCGYHKAERSPPSLISVLPSYNTCNSWRKQGKYLKKKLKICLHFQVVAARTLHLQQFVPMAYYSPYFKKASFEICSVC